MRRLLRLVVSLVVLFGLVFGTVTLVRLANGDFAGDYTLSGTFPEPERGSIRGRPWSSAACRWAGSPPSPSSTTWRRSRC